MKHLLIVLALLCTFAHAEPFSEVRSAQASILPITDGVNLAPQQTYAVCSPYAAGKTADIRWQVEVTNPLQFNVGVGWHIMAWDYKTVDGLSSYVASYPITPPVMQNVTPAGHHMVIQNSYLHKITYPPGTPGPVRCYTLVLWAVASGGGGNIVVEPGYGYLQVAVRD